MKNLLFVLFLLPSIVFGSESHLAEKVVLGKINERAEIAKFVREEMSKVGSPLYKQLEDLIKEYGNPNQQNHLKSIEGKDLWMTQSGGKNAIYTSYVLPIYLQYKRGVDTQAFLLINTIHDGDEDKTTIAITSLADVKISPK